MSVDLLYDPAYLVEVIRYPCGHRWRDPDTLVDTAENEERVEMSKLSGLILLLWASTLPAQDDYDRRLYRHWIDADGDCQNTRHEVLIAESLVPVVLDSTGCRVVFGWWLCPYTFKLFNDPGKLDIDHFIPLKEAHLSGGNQWGEAKRRLYANDLSHPHSLIAVSLRANRSKGAKDPAEWMPPNKAYHCQYVATWLALKYHWQLALDAKEKRFLADKIGSCLKPF